MPPDGWGKGKKWPFLGFFGVFGVFRVFGCFGGIKRVVFRPFLARVLEVIKLYLCTYIGPI